MRAHREEVRDAILDAAWALAAEHGPAGTKMADVAEQAGIGRATLYKYFPDVGAILAAWHARHIHEHLTRLEAVRNTAATPGERLGAVLGAYANIYRGRAQHRQGAPHGIALDTLLHQGEHVTRAQQQLHLLIRDLLQEAAQAGAIRDDIAPDELASYCLHALTAAGTLRSEAAIRRLVAITLHGLSPAMTAPSTPNEKNRPRSRSAR